MSGYVQVKAILLREGGKKEVRRFRLEDGEKEEEKGRRSEMGAERGGGSCGRRGGSRFMNLLTRIHSVFNMDTATQQHCTLYWRDEDDDMVQFSTDEELGHALEHSAGDPFRVYVIVSDDSNMEDDDGLEGETEVTRQRHVTFDVTPPFTDPSTVSRVACPGMHCGHVGRKGRHVEWKMNKMREAGKNNEFKKLREQVPEQFRSWVRQFVRSWYTQGQEAETTTSMEAAMTAVKDKLPEQVDKQFPEWLHAFLIRHRPQQGAGSPAGEGEGDEETEMEVGEGEEAPEGLPSAYFQWLCLFLPRFYWRQRHGRAARSGSCDGAEGRGCHGDGHVTRGHKGHGKHGCHRGRKGNKQGLTSSESEDSETEQKKLPKEFRQYVRITMKRLHKTKGDNITGKEKEPVTGVSPEVKEFVEQILLEWHAKLSRQRPRAVAMEMMAEERSLPAGVHQEHFQWLCRFMARWHRRHAGKCDVMSGWSSGETTSTDEEAVCGVQQARAPWPYNNRRHFRAAMKMTKAQGMMVHPGPHFSTHPGMYYTYAMSTPYGPKCGVKRCGKMNRCGQQDGGKCRKVKDGAAQGDASPTHDEMMERVTEDVRKM